MIRLIILRLFESYFRHRWLNLVPIVVLLFAASGYIALSKPEYISIGTLYVQKASLLSSLTKIQDDGFSWRTPTQIAVNEVSELLQTDAFIRSAIKKTDLEAEMARGPDAITTAMDSFRQSVQVQMVGDNLIEFIARNRDPKLAQQLASATIEAYTQWKLNADQQESAVAQSFFAEVIPPYQQELQRARNELKTFLETHPQPLRGERLPEEQVQIAQIQAAIDLASTRLENALDKEESARLAQSQAESNVRQNYLVIDAPTLPSKPERSLKTIVLNASIFLVIGVFLSGAGVVGGALLDHSFRFALDVRSALDLPVLALVPDLRQIPAATPALQSEASPQPASLPTHQLEAAEPATAQGENLPVGMIDQVAA
ncbi:MAG: lipopolysaccharide biosynthesis protein [Kouleothrix sp.]|jgi:uncharacterized protein involved in exopolysaccharide biosynthesis|nr:lipopolysaccharide biosynthesis protein [Kouleothrix sp.]